MAGLWGLLSLALFLVGYLQPLPSTYGAVQHKDQYLAVLGSQFKHFRFVNVKTRDGNVAMEPGIEG